MIGRKPAGLDGDWSPTLVGPRRGHFRLGDMQRIIPTSLDVRRLAGSTRSSPPLNRGVRFQQYQGFYKRKLRWLKRLFVNEANGAVIKCGCLNNHNVPRKGSGKPIGNAAEGFTGRALPARSGAPSRTRDEPAGSILFIVLAGSVSRWTAINPQQRVRSGFPEAE